MNRFAMEVIPISVADLAPTESSLGANLEATATVVRGYRSKGGGYRPDWSLLLATHCVYEDWSPGRFEGADLIRRSILEPYADSFADQYHQSQELISHGSRLVASAGSWGVSSVNARVLRRPGPR